MAGAIKVEGLREFQRACNKSQKDVKKGLRTRLLKVGEVVARDAKPRFAPIDATAAGRFRPRVRTGMVAVEQPKRKTTGMHPEFGRMQLGIALIPALEAKSGEVEREFNDMLDDLVHGF